MLLIILIQHQQIHNNEKKYIINIIAALLFSIVGTSVFGQLGYPNNYNPTEWKDFIFEKDMTTQQLHSVATACQIPNASPAYVQHMNKEVETRLKNEQQIHNLAQNIYKSQGSSCVVQENFVLTIYMKPGDPQPDADALLQIQMRINILIEDLARDDDRLEGCDVNRVTNISVVTLPDGLPDFLTTFDHVRIFDLHNSNELDNFATQWQDDLMQSNPHNMIMILLPPDPETPYGGVSDPHCGNPEKTVIFGIENSLSYTDEANTNIANKAGHELGHYFYANHQTNDDGSYVNQEVVCEDDNAAFSEIGIISIMGSVSGGEALENYAVDNGYWTASVRTRIIKTWEEMSETLTIQESITLYADADGDGYGDATVSIQSCEAETGYIDNTDDCDDTNPDINPDATEACDGIDNNCDGQIDEDLSLLTYYADTDGDGFGDPMISMDDCIAPADYVTNADDCDDSNPATNPDAIEIEGNQVNENCDGSLTPTTEVNLNEIKIFPNPMGDYLHIVSDHQIKQITIYDNLGKAILTSSDTRKISVSNLTKGVYYILIHIDEQTRYYHKITK